MSVQSLEMLEEQHQLLDVREAQPVVHAVKWMRHGVRELLGGEILLQVEDILPRGLQSAVLRLGEAPDEHVNLAAVVGETRAHLLAEKDARPVGDFEATLDAVVVGQRHEIHAARPQRVVKRVRLGVAVRQTDTAEEPLRGAGAVAGVQVEIGLHDFGTRSFSNSASAMPTT